MKTLVIHPEDPTTNFLKTIYKDTDWVVISNNIVSKKVLREQIKLHDRIIMLGHGNKYGLFGSKRLIIDSSWVQMLREKDCVAIWCNADEFVEKYGLTGLYTGMVISEYEEAIMFCVGTKGNEIEESNILFSESMRDAIKSSQPLKIATERYVGNTNVINFNKERIYFR